MIRNLKALGLALVAMFAMGAVAASAASAQDPQGELTADGPVTLKATETGEPLDNSLTAFEKKVTCPGSTLTGHAVLTHKETEEKKEHGVITTPVTKVTVTPHYNQEACTVDNELDATVEMNGCDFVLTAGKTTDEVAGTYGVTADITCPTGKQIHVGVWGAETSHTEGRLCTIEVPGQEGLAGAHLTHTTGAVHDIDIKGTFTGIHVTRHGLCLLDGKGTKDEGGKFDIDMTIKGYNAEGGETPVTITDKVA